MTNPYLSFKNDGEQDLVESLIGEAIQIHGEQFYYIPKTLVSPDEILGEDRLSTYKNYYPFTAYFESAMQFEGQGAFMQRFGGFLDYQATLLVQRNHWMEKVGEYGTTNLPNRPCEGDLIYWDLTDSLFVIKYVDDKNPFAQLGKFYTWKLQIELWQYSSEQMDTGNNEIDVFESLKTFDTKTNRSAWQGVVKVDIVDPGEGYRELPMIFVQSATGQNAQFKCRLENGSLKSVEIIDGGEGYHQKDSAIVIGNCNRPAQVRILIKNRVENDGDKWGANEPLDREADKALKDREHLFGDIKPSNKALPSPEDDGAPEIDWSEWFQEIPDDTPIHGNIQEIATEKLDGQRREEKIETLDDMIMTAPPKKKPRRRRVTTVRG